MHKVIWLSRFKQGIAAEEADAHWQDVHAALMRDVPGVERYVQNRWVAPVADGVPGPDQLHLHSECWFTDEAAYHRAMASPEWAAIAADAPNCFDNSALVGAVVEERVLIE